VKTSAIGRGAAQNHAHPNRGHLYDRIGVVYVYAGGVTLERREGSRAGTRTRRASRALVRSSFSPQRWDDTA